MTESVTRKIKAATDQAGLSTSQSDKSDQGTQKGGDGKGGKNALAGLSSQLPLDRLKNEAQGLGSALVMQGFSRASNGIESLTGKLNDYAQGGITGAAPKMAKNLAKGDSPGKAGIKTAMSKVTDKVKEKLGGGGGGGGQKIKVTNILEYVEVPVPRQVAYEQWTLFEDFPTFMKKVENVNQEEDEKLRWRAQIFWSHRSWDAEIVEQVPNERILWKSDGQKGHVDGAVTFHELTPDLTRVQIVLEYNPKGFFEHTGNLWRAQGRRARLELKHFARHVSTRTILHQDEVNGWKGEIRDSHVVEGEESKEQQDQGGQGPDQQDKPQDKGQGKDARDKQSDTDQSQADDQADDQAGQEKREQTEGQDGQQAQASKPRPRPRKKAAAKVSKAAASKRPRRATSKASAG